MSVQYDKFESLIENGREEAPLQEFLEAHPSIVRQAFDGGSYYPTVFPKFSLAGEFIPDFVMIGHRSSWMWTVDLIEIEPSVLERPLFNRADQPTGRLEMLNVASMDGEKPEHVLCSQSSGAVERAPRLGRRAQILQPLGRNPKR